MNRMIRKALVAGVFGVAVGVVAGPAVGFGVYVVAFNVL
jgi:hypothetical protein